METLEGNRLIANFEANHAINSPHLKEDKELRYHESWDWLMPVVEKIEQMEYGVEIRFFSCTISDPAIFDTTNLHIESHGNTKIEATWEAVVEFIKQTQQNGK